MDWQTVLLIVTSPFWGGFLFTIAIVLLDIVGAIIVCFFLLARFAVSMAVDAVRERFRR